MSRQSAQVLGDAEVRQVGVPVVVEQHVGGLHVAVHRVGPVRGRERAGQLIHDPRGVLGVGLGAHEDVLEAAAAHPAHHEVRATPVAPVVVEGDHVRMLETRDRLRLLLEASDEAGVVGQTRVDLLHADLSAELRVERAPDDPERALPDPLEQPVPAERFPGELQRRILLQHPALQLLQLLRRIDPQLVREQLLRLAERIQGFRLTPGPVASQHQVRPEALAKRVLADQPFEVGEHLRVLADTQARADQVLDRRHAQLLEPSDLTVQRGRVGQIAERRAGPEDEGLVERARGLAGIGREQTARPPQELLEAEHVELVGLGVDHVAGAPALDPVRAQRGAEV